MGADVQGLDSAGPDPTNLIVIKGIVFLVVSWTDWDEAGVYRLGPVVT
jgi:hypothetical protein